MLRPSPSFPSSVFALCLWLQSWSASRVRFLCTIEHRGLCFLFISTCEDYETDSQRFSSVSFVQHFWTELEFCIQRLAHSSSLGTGFPFFIPSVSYLLFFLPAFPRLHSISFGENIHKDCWGDMFSFCIIFKERSKKKPQVSRSMWLCFNPHSSRSERWQLSCGDRSRFKTVIISCAKGSSS